jgi:HlyD family secretion protein
MKRSLIALFVVAGLASGAYWLYTYAQEGPGAAVHYATVSRGDVVETIGATGQLEPLDKVQVGTQVSGVILALHADFNSVVRKGQLLAVLDPKIIETQILQAEANLVRAETEVDRNRVMLEDATKKFARTSELSARGIVNQVEYDAAEIAVKSADSTLKSSEAALNQQRAALEQQKLNLEHTRIYSPIDGIVVSRAVDVGQTVQASMQAPVLFNLAADLAAMRVVASIDEADVGRIRPQQHVTFRIDAYPDDTFTGTVEQVRLEPKLQQNVVTYSAVISVPNRELKLKPGMTANITIEIARRNDVVRVPNTALRFRPTTDMYLALGADPPEPANRSGQEQARGRATGGKVSRAGGGDEDGGSQSLPLRNPASERSGQARSARERATTIDALFPPLDPVDSRGRVWTWDADRKVLSPHSIRLGITDGQLTELLEGNVQDGTQVVTHVVTQQSVRPAGFTQNPTANPFMQQPGGGRPGAFPGGARRAPSP